MEFKLERTVEILSATPAVLKYWLSELSSGWTHNNEGPETWSAYDIVGHLIHGEKTDWIPRVRLIIESGEALPFIPFDRFAQFKESQGRKLGYLLEEFEKIRKENLAILNELPVMENLDKTGIHPALGKVTLRELLATWPVHDLNHIYQMSRVMAYQYKDQVGAWKEYLGIIPK